MWPYVPAPDGFILDSKIGMLMAVDEGDGNMLQLWLQQVTEDG